MPFTPVEQLPQNPAVRIFFSGLLIIRPSADASSCEVFVHRSAPDHHLTIETRRKRANRPDEIMMRHVGPLSFVTFEDVGHTVHGLFIQKLTEGEKGVRKYVGPPTDEGLSLERALDLTAQPFHSGSNLTVDPLGARPSLFLDDAVFYTADLTREGLEIRLRAPGGQEQPLNPFASLIGANIYLGEDDTGVGLRWVQQGRLQSLVLRRPEAGVSYEIYIVNDPLFESDEITDPALLHDEFREYYKILSVPSPDQFRLVIPPPPEGTPRGTTRAPCMSVLLNA